MINTFFDKKIFYKYLPLLFLLTLAFSSCRTQRSVLYNPTEVQELSEKMRFDIANSDPNIPLYAEISTWLGVPYRYSGLSRRGIDCSGFTCLVFQNVYSRKIPRSTSGLEKATQSISRSKLKTGDLVFFATGRTKKISHVGIYLKEGYFAHASTSKGVIISHLDEKYYKRKWKRGGRLK